MVGQRFVQIVSEEPADGKAVGGYSHQLALRADVLEELISSCKRKKTTGSTLGLPPLAYTAGAPTLSRRRDLASLRGAGIEVVSRDEILQRDVIRYRGEEALLDAQHGVGSSLIFVSLCRGSSDASLVRDGGECTVRGLPYLVRFRRAGNSLFRRVTSFENPRGLVGTAPRGDPAASQGCDR